MFKLNKMIFKFIWLLHIQQNRLNTKSNLLIGQIK